MMINIENTKTEQKYITPPRTLRKEEEIMSSWCGSGEVMVSIHCMAFNHESFIEDAIHGFLIQETSFPFEVLIHDDALTDNTAEIIKSYVEKYPEIIKPIYQKENTYSKGYKSGFFNLMRVKGKYTALCEGDDFWFDKNKLQMQVEFLEKNPTYVMCGHDVTQIQPDCEIIKESELKLSEDTSYSSNRIALGFNLPSKAAMWRSNLPCLGSKMPFGDTFLFSYYGNFGKAYNFKKVMGVYRIHQGGVWSGLTKSEQLASSLNILKEIPNYTLMQYRSIAYFKLFVFMIYKRSDLNLSRNKYVSVLLALILSLRVNSFIYLSYTVTSSLFSKAARKLGLIKESLK